MPRGALQENATWQVPCTVLMVPFRHLQNSEKNQQLFLVPPPSPQPETPTLHNSVIMPPRRPATIKKNETAEQWRLKLLNTSEDEVMKDFGYEDLKEWHEVQLAEDARIEEEAKKNGSAWRS
ncbi:hypothetical protein C8R43DRAFT_1143760 [Mycena crocata]|nr:hypothetical protein C8R43DRAFT_1143760 [Mycena crocata]